MVTEYNHRGAERTEDERTEDCDYLGNGLAKLRRQKRHVAD